VEYQQGHTIYDAEHWSRGLYVVIEGRVEVSRLAASGSEVITGIYGPDEFFGESALLNSRDQSERATALDNGKVMTWDTLAIQEIVLRRPALAVALLQVFVQRTIEFKERVESLCGDTMNRRLARTLISLSQRLGTPQEDGSVSMLPLTHEMLARHAGTTREAVTQHMNRYRRAGYIRYSRRGIILYRDAFKDWLRQSL
jgi:CRP/FNR family transcriptional regulator